MRQAVLVAPKQIVFKEVAAPKAADLNARQVLIQVKRIGICGSEIHSYHGLHPATFYPVVQGHEYAGFFMDRIERPEPPNVLLSATRLLYHMGKIFQSSAPAPQSCGVQIDRKRLAKLRRMRMAAGHKADDHEQEQTSSTMSMGW